MGAGDVFRKRIEGVRHGDGQCMGGVPGSISGPHRIFRRTRYITDR
jgi:hypothetical protein